MPGGDVCPDESCSGWLLRFGQSSQAKKGVGGPSPRPSDVVPRPGRLPLTTSTLVVLAPIVEGNSAGAGDRDRTGMASLEG